MPNSNYPVVSYICYIISSGVIKLFLLLFLINHDFLLGDTPLGLLTFLTL